MTRGLRIVLAGTLAIGAIAGLFVSGGMTTLADYAKAPAVKAGFAGIADFGHWRLICVPGPGALDGLSPAAAKTVRTMACRVNQEVRNPAAGAGGTGIILAVNFSALGPKRTHAVMLRLPATANPGDEIRFILDGKNILTTNVRECAAECLAAGPLSDADWARLSHAQTVQIAFPASGGQPVLLDLPLDGLRVSIEAMERAQRQPAF